MKELNRRHFLQCLGAGALALGAAPHAPVAARGAVRQAAAAPALATPRYPGRVVEVFGTDVLDGAVVRQDVVDRMLERGLMELTGATDLAGAWKLFVTPADVVGLKVNTLSGPGCSTRREVVQAIVRGLKTAGVKDANIIIWDRFESHLRRTNYAIAQKPGALRCYATDSPGVGSDMDVFYEANVLEWVPAYLRGDPARGYAASYNNSHFSAIFTQHITKQINVPILKDHNITGLTLGLKNVAFGICSNTERFHPTPINCDPMIGQVCAHPMVQSKNVLTIADCLSILYEGGPMFDPRYLLSHRSLIIGTDMVATDTIGLGILEQIRRDKGLPSLWKTNSPPKYLNTAAALKLGVGSVEEIAHLKLEVRA
jgi:uncharacterized protein (DUF362 family)